MGFFDTCLLINNQEQLQLTVMPNSGSSNDAALIATLIIVFIAKIPGSSVRAQETLVMN